jgi:hypothetical protein
MFLLSLLHDILINIYILYLLLNRKQLAVNVLKSTPVKLVTKPLVMNVSLVSDGGSDSLVSRSFLGHCLKLFDFF